MSVADLTEPAHESVLDAVLASAANQLAFAAQLLKMRRAGAYQDVENWPASNEFWCSDSAILDREPISRTLQVTADIDDESTAGMRRHLVIEPQPRVAGRETQWAARNAPPTWLKTLLRTLAIVEGQTVYDDISAFEDRNLRAAKVNALISRLEPALDDLPMDATRALREALGGSGDQSLTNLVRAKVSEAADVDGREPATVEVISPDLVKLNPGPVNDRLAGEFLFRFGGLLDENLRQSDFDLGYLSTISWLEHEPERPEGAPDGNTEVPALKLGRDARMFAAAVARRANPRVEELRPGWRPPELSMRGRLRMLRFFHRVAVVGAHDVYVGRRDRRRTLSAVG
jgi:hypothetical protein